MIRTLIEIQAENEKDHERQLNKALDQLGYEQKRNADEVAFFHDLAAALRGKGMVPWDLVNRFRGKEVD